MYWTDAALKHYGRRHTHWRRRYHTLSLTFYLSFGALLFFAFFVPWPRGILAFAFLPFIFVGGAALTRLEQQALRHYASA